MKTYFVKLGGSIITDTSKPYTARVPLISKLLNKIKKVEGRNSIKVIVGHGGGSFPHVPAHKYRVNEGLVNRLSWKGAALTHHVADELNRIVVSEALKLGLRVFPFSPSSFSLWRSGESPEGYVGQIREALKKGFVPIVYGDVVFDSKKGVSIASTEQVFSFIAKSIRPSRIILTTDVDGVFDKDPKIYPDAKLINVIDSTNIDKVLNGAGGSHKVDVTGGMATKLSLLYCMVKQNDALGIIVNGTKPELFEKALQNKIDENSGLFTVVKP